MLRRSFVSSAAAAAALPFLPASRAAAQSVWPLRTVQIVVPFGAGGPTDVAARLVANAIQEKTGQRFQIENRVQQGVVGGSDSVAKAPKDGHTLLFSTVAHVSARALFPRLPYDLERDFTPVSLVGLVPMVLLVAPNSPHQTLNDLVSHLRANAGQLDYGSSGIGGAVHLATELFKRAYSVDVGHVPYRSSALAVQDMAQGKIVMVFDTLAGGVAAVRAGRAKALAVTGSRRSGTLPDVPTFAELGRDVNAATWNMIFAPGGTPDPVLRRIYEEVNAALGSSEVKGRFAELGIEIVPDGTPERAARFVLEQIALWEPLIRSANIRAE